MKVNKGMVKICPAENLLKEFVLRIKINGCDCSQNKCPWFGMLIKKCGVIWLAGQLGILDKNFKNPPERIKP